MKAAVMTLGCKVNQYESSVIIQKLIDEGFEIVDFETYADVYIVNTCTVTAISDKKSRQALRRAKKQNPNSIVVATGCYTETSKDELLKIDEIDIIAGNEEKTEIVSKVIEALGDKALDIMNHPTNKYEYHGRTRANIKIEDGCNNFCSYCIIPYARGRVRSRKIDDILAEFNSLSKEGYKEIVITGIEVSSFGLDTGEKLIDLLSAINGAANPYDIRIRLGSLEPRLITKDFVDKLAKLKHICPQYHLALQSGCDETLKRMKRRYTTADFYNGVQMLRDSIPNVMFTTDILVGFPGETEEEFNETVEFVKKIGFLKAHIFPYSIRKGTRAASMENQIDKKTKEKRVKILDEISKEIRSNILKEQIGKTHMVLFETEISKNVYEGYTENYIPVHVTSHSNLEGCLHSVKITESFDDFCIGNIE